MPEAAELADENFGLEDLLNEGQPAREVEHEDGQSDEAEDIDEGIEPEGDEAGSEDAGEDEDESSESDSVQKSLEKMQKRIDALTAEKNRWKERASKSTEKLSEVNRKIKPDAPWEADEQYVTLSQEREGLERQISNAETILDALLDDPDEARELIERLELKLPRDDSAARRQLRAWIKSASADLRRVDKDMGVIEDRGRRHQESRQNELAAVVDKFFSFLDDEESPEYQVAQQIGDQYLGHLRGLPESEYKFLLGAVTNFVGSIQRSQGGAKPQVAAPRKPEPKLAERQGSRPKVGAGSGSTKTRSDSDGFGQALSKIDPDDMASLARALGNLDDI